jgi:protocatechuate 3,4-dioxygenase beta subunit
MPAGAALGLPPEHVSALIAHELAHVRRLDYPINVVQRLIEALLFYHPAIWWVSNQIRVEREMCCDDLVVAANGDALTYARALTELEAARRTRATTALAIDSAPLLGRIRRLLGHAPPLSHELPGPGAVISMTLLWLIGIGAAAAHSSPATLSTPQNRDAVIAPPAPLEVVSGSSLLTTVLLGPVGPVLQPRVQQAPARVQGAAVPGLPPPRPESPEAQGGDGVIRGRIVQQDTGLPLRNALVLVRATGVPRPPTATTDQEGMYEIRGLPPARYTLRASKGGFVPIEFGQTRPNAPGRPLQLADGEVLEKVDVALPPGGVITGRVFDEEGEPISGAVVQAVRQRYSTEGRQPGDVVGTSDITDDLGQFRVFGLPQGAFLLRAITTDPRAPDMTRIMSATATGGPATFYPGTLVPEFARPVDVGPGTQVAGLVLQILPTRLFGISGTVHIPGDIPRSEVRLTLRQLGTTRPIGLRPDGSFAMPELAPGEYTLMAEHPATGYAAQTRVRLDGADADVTLALRPGHAIRGRITFETVAARAALQTSDVRVFLDAVATGPMVFGPRPTPRDDWTFDVGGLAGQYRVRTILPDGWAVKRVQHRGLDLTDTFLDVTNGDLDGVEILLTQRLTLVSGGVTDNRGRVTSDATIVVFADDAGRWGPQSRFVRTARPDQNGRFSIRALPAGRYVAVAVDHLDAGDEFDPDVLGRLQPLGTRFTLGDGDARELSLRLASF